MPRALSANTNAACLAPDITKTRWQATIALANANRSHYSSRMIVCICHRVSDRDIARAAREGCASFDELQMELAVATSCGKLGAVICIFPFRGE